ncbi:biosynthesis cluster domain-containing protein [Sphaerisporangium album]|uniref:Biosynthesis cluster domain-containing protein n=1 Tax=Sphaerisporangium album TaxID=509200 RepID=A0A367F9X4_9ACTN|nr:LnmK family bifunctional acyltransferase/decarboxylase [Sphaerisporangium album]RCG27071.1 biosynthesis cluster domain-containing protein [Sphaerisporangium album]
MSVTTHDRTETSDGSTAARSVLVKPGMCGHNSLFVGRLGDWTWETVSDLCGTNAFDATNADGSPTYLSFYYFHIRGSRQMHVHGLTFGDRLRVASRLFDFGSESILTLHEVRPEGGPDAPVDPDRFYAYDDPRCIYVENYNRWISRSRPGSNRDLVKSSPVGFRHDHLPRLPDAYSPRRVYDHARNRLTFLDGLPADRVPRPGFTLDYPIDASRDLNGVGLLYFASYFSIIDWALLRYWRRLGRGTAAFLDRVVLDQRLCYLGNADADSVLRISVDSWQKAGDPGDEIVNLVVRDRDTGRTVAVSTLHVLSTGGAHDGA